LQNIKAIKEANPDVAQSDEIYRLTKDFDFYIYSGNDDRAFHMICAGAKGVISVASNVVPAQMVELVNSIFSNDISHALEMHFFLVPIFLALLLNKSIIIPRDYVFCVLYVL
jgi:Dihydrodipicolinate synthase/N-acetylneuraminate lyase